MQQLPHERQVGPPSLVPTPTQDPWSGCGLRPIWPEFQASGPLIPHGGREEQSYMLGPGRRAGFCGQQASGILEGAHCSGRPQPGRGLVQRQCLAPRKEKGSTELQEKAGGQRSPAGARRSHGQQPLRGRQPRSAPGGGQPDPRSAASSQLTALHSPKSRRPAAADGTKQNKAF